MADNLVVEWDREQLILATGSASASSIRLNQVVHVDRAPGLLPDELGRELSTVLNNSGLKAASAVVVFPRELVTFFRIELPNLPEAELPEMVQMQAATRLTVPVESVCLDFAPLPVKANADMREVLLVTAPRQHVEEAVACLRSCEITLAGIKVSSFSIAAAAEHGGLVSSTSPGTVEALVSLTNDSIEMIFLENKQVVFSHSGSSWSSLEAVEQAVRKEISRARMAAAQDLGAYQVSKLTLLGSEEVTSAVPDSVASRLNDAPVVRVDPSEQLINGSFPDDVTAADAVALAGVITGNRNAGESVDLVNPRKPVEKKDLRRVKSLGGVAAVLILCAVFFNWRSGKVAELHGQRDDYNADTEEIESDYKMSRAERDVGQRLQSWKDRKRSQLDLINQVKELMVDTDRVYIKNFNSKVSTGDSLGTIVLRGLAKKRGDVEDLGQILTDAGFEVEPKEIPSSMQDPKYPVELNLEVRIPESMRVEPGRAKQESPEPPVGEKGDRVTQR